MPDASSDRRAAPGLSSPMTSSPRTSWCWRPPWATSARGARRMRSSPRRSWPTWPSARASPWSDGRAEVVAGHGDRGPRPRRAPGRARPGPAPAEARALGLPLARPRPHYRDGASGPAPLVAERDRLLGLVPRRALVGGRRGPLGLAPGARARGRRGRRGRDGRRPLAGGAGPRRRPGPLPLSRPGRGAVAPGAPGPHAGATRRRTPRCAPRRPPRPPRRRARRWPPRRRRRAAERRASAEPEGRGRVDVGPAARDLEVQVGAARAPRRARRARRARPRRRTRRPRGRSPTGGRSGCAAPPPWSSTTVRPKPSSQPASTTRPEAAARTAVPDRAGKSSPACMPDPRGP